MTEKVQIQAIYTINPLLDAVAGDRYGPLKATSTTGAPGTDGILYVATIPIDQLGNLVNWFFLSSVGPNLNLDVQPLVTLSAGLNYTGVANLFNNDLASTDTNMNNVTALSSAKIVTQPGNWSIQHDPAVNVLATVTRAAAAGTKHICTSIHATLAAVAATGVIKLYLKDGTTVGPIIWSAALICPANTVSVISLSGLSIGGTTNNAMTLEFGAAPGLTNFENVSLTGFSVVA